MVEIRRGGLVEGRLDSWPEAFMLDIWSQTCLPARLPGVLRFRICAYLFVNVSCITAASLLAAMGPLSRR
jgi:hypothetical protein